MLPFQGLHLFCILYAWNYLFYSYWTFIWYPTSCFVEDNILPLNFGKAEEARHFSSWKKTNLPFRKWHYAIGTWLRNPIYRSTFVFSWKHLGFFSYVSPFQRVLLGLNGSLKTLKLGGNKQLNYSRLYRSLLKRSLRKSKPVRRYVWSLQQLIKM